ncbi:hypothetical protein FUAX_13370 [Fulvitalea axinellae]|uniref:Outer membrane protein beta-barrel domain-containing protein n=1 Tax=Fulvitalea axinellae TaxID=1182444 RepID=A0AAU9DDF0_9BACT|nr:hypothetical protein FUAX_13370 [Fulvitalea axinellae]
MKVFVRLFLVTALVSVNGFLFGQSNFKPGYIKTAKGDSIIGFVNYQDWDRTPRLIKFKRTVDAEANSYGPGSLLAFGLVSPEIKYEACDVKMDLVEQREGKIPLDTDNKGVWILRREFLEVLEAGEISLLRYKGIRELFFIKVNGVVEQLVHRKYYLHRNGETLIKHDQTYKRQLLYVFRNNDKVDERRIRKVGYNYEDLRELFNEVYTTGKPEEKKDKERFKRILFQYGVVAGGGVSSISFKGNAKPSVTGADFAPTINFSAGLFSEFVLVSNFKRWSLYNELVYNSRSVEGDFLYRRGPRLLNGETEVELGTLSLTNMVRYTYGFGKVKVFVGIGMNVAFIADVSSVSVTKYDNAEESEVSEPLNDDNIRPYSLGFASGLGLRTGRFVVEARGNFSSNFSELVFMEAKAKDITLMLSYRIF